MNWITSILLLISCLITGSTKAQGNEAGNLSQQLADLRDSVGQEMVIAEEMRRTAGGELAMQLDDARQKLGLIKKDLDTWIESYAKPLGIQERQSVEESAQTILKDACVKFKTIVRRLRSN